MATLIHPEAFRSLLFGNLVTRDTATLPATATGGLFVVSGGGVWVTSLIGEVTTAVQNQACNTKIVATPTTGSVNDLSAVVDIANLGVGGLLSITGLAGDATVKSTGGGVSNLRNPIFVAVGTIGLSTAATNTGSIKWRLTYVPADDAGSVAAA